jgi:hypothetical protein
MICESMKFLTDCMRSENKEFFPNYLSIIYLSAIGQFMDQLFDCHESYS